MTRALPNQYLIGDEPARKPDAIVTLHVPDAAMKVLRAVPWLAEAPIPYFPKRKVRTHRA